MAGGGRGGGEGLRLLLGARLDAELGAGLHQVRRHVAHAHALLEARRVAAARDDAHLDARRVEASAAPARARLGMTKPQLGLGLGLPNPNLTLTLTALP